MIFYDFHTVINIRIVTKRFPNQGRSPIFDQINLRYEPKSKESTGQSISTVYISVNAGFVIIENIKNRKKYDNFFIYLT